MLMVEPSPDREKISGCNPIMIARPVAPYTAAAAAALG